MMERGVRRDRLVFEGKTSGPDRALLTPREEDDSTLGLCGGLGCRVGRRGRVWRHLGGADVAVEADAAAACAPPADATKAALCIVFSREAIGFVAADPSFDGKGLLAV